MSNLKYYFSIIFTNIFFQRIFGFFLLIILLYFIRDFFWIFLLTFIFSFLFFTLARFLKNKINDFIDNRSNKKSYTLKFIKNFFSINVIVIIEYIIFAGGIIFLFVTFFPKIINELQELLVTGAIPGELSENVSLFIEQLRNFNDSFLDIWNSVFTFLNDNNYSGIIEKLKSASSIFFHIILSLILSFVFIIDRKKLNKYLLKIKDSSFKFLYDDYKIIIEKIVKSFGLIIKAQSIIALVNSTLTTIGLLIIGFFYNGGLFPFIITIAVSVFILGFIPILGTFISSAPIIIIAYNFVGGINTVIAVIFLIILVHSIEAYYLNPKIVSSFLELPVSLTFVILLVCEHFFGFAGLLVGISLFYFSIGLLSDLDEVFKKIGKKLREK